jgi:hypothetical protein
MSETEKKPYVRPVLTRREKLGAATAAPAPRGQLSHSRYDAHSSVSGGLK